MSLVIQLMVLLLCVHSLYGTHHYNLTIGLLLEEPIQKENKVAERAAHFAYMLNACDLQPITVETFILKQDDPFNNIYQISEFLKKNMTAIISKISCSTFHLLNSQPKACHLLHFTIIPPFCGETSLTSNNCNVFSLRERGEYLQTAIIDLLLELNFKKLTILVDESSSETAIDLLFQKISDNYIQIRPYKVDGNLSHIFLPETKTYEHSYYLLLMKPSLVRHVFNEASKFNIHSGKMYWIIVSSDGTVDSMFANGTLTAIGRNVLIVRKSWNRAQNTSCSYKISVKPQMTLIDAYIADAVILLANTIAELMRKDRITDDTDKRDFTRNVKDDILKKHSSGIFVSATFDNDGFSANSAYNMFSVIQNDNNGRVLEKKVATWNRMNRLTILTNLFPLEPSGFGNVTFRVGVLLTEPYTMIKGNTYEGLCIDILRELSESLQFRYELIDTTALASGNKQPNGSWNGLIGEVMRHDLNLSIGPFTLTEEREDVVAFTVPFAVEKRGIMVKSAAASEESAFRMLRPFQPLLWLALAGVIVLVSFTLTLINWLKRDDASSLDDYKITSTLWLVFTYHMQQVVVNEPRTVTSRLLVGFWWMFIILMINYYTATLASTLTITINVAPIQNLAQLSQPDCPYNPIAIYDSSTYGTFLNSNKTVDKHILKGLESIPQVRNSSMALHLTLTDQYAFISMNSQLEYLKSLYCKELTIILDDTYVYQVGFILPQDSVYTQKLSYGIRKLHEAGLIEKWRHKWWSDPNKCSKQGPHGDPLKLWSLAGPYFIYIGFIGLGFIILAAEGIVTAFTRRKPEEDNNNAMQS